MDSHEKTENRLYFPTVLVLHDNIQQGISFKPGTAYFGRVGGRHLAPALIHYRFAGYDSISQAHQNVDVLEVDLTSPKL